MMHCIGCPLGMLKKGMHDNLHGYGGMVGNLIPSYIAPPFGEFDF